MIIKINNDKIVYCMSRNYKRTLIWVKSDDKNLKFIELNNFFIDFFLIK